MGGGPRDTLPAVPGLHLVLLEQARADGLPVARGHAVPWLSGRGHLAPAVFEAGPIVLEALASMHSALGGDAEALAAKRPANPPTPDLIHTHTGAVIEIDETQHFTSARLLTFEHYPHQVALGFDVDEYRQLIGRWRTRADAAFAHRVSKDFPRPGGRQAQRAYNDALRDFLAPTFTGLPVVRIPAPERSPSAAMARLRQVLR